MAQWMTAEALASETGISNNLLFCIFGLYFWEVLQTSDFEWSLITRTRKFCWPLAMIQIFFFICRYCMLFALIGVIVAVQATEPIHCGALYTFNAWATNMAILCGTDALMVRTAELWDNAVVAVLPLAFLGCVHWAVLWRAVFLVDASWDVDAEGCAATATDHGFLDASFFTTLAVSLVVLLMTAVPLSQKRAQLNVRKMFFKDGLAYFCVPFLCSIVPAVLNALDLNNVMDLVTIVPAAALSSVAACRLVMRRARPPPDVYVQGPAQLTENARLRRPCGRGGRPSFAVGVRPVPEVHVTTDCITVEDFPAVPPRVKRSSTRSSLDEEVLAYDR